MLKPDKKIKISDLDRLNDHGIGVIVDATEDGSTPNSATLFSGMSIVLIRANAEGVIDRIEPNLINNMEVADILSAVSYVFATVLDRVD
jgi:hypothetical protein